MENQEPSKRTVLIAYGYDGNTYWYDVDNRIWCHCNASNLNSIKSADRFNISIATTDAQTLGMELQRMWIMPFDLHCRITNNQASQEDLDVMISLIHNATPVIKGEKK